MSSRQGEITVLKRINILERELEELKRDIIRNLLLNKNRQRRIKPSLFGSVHGGDITEEMINEAKCRIFRNINDI